HGIEPDIGRPAGAASGRLGKQAAAYQVPQPASLTGKHRGEINDPIADQPSEAVQVALSETQELHRSGRPYRPLNGRGFRFSAKARALSAKSSVSVSLRARV